MVPRARKSSPARAVSARDILCVSSWCGFIPARSLRVVRVQFLRMESGPVVVNPDSASLYSAHFGVLRWIATRKFGVPDVDADALIHEVFVSYLLVRRPLVDVERWLVGGVCNQARSYWRARLRDEVPSDRFADPRTGEFDESVLREFTVARILGLLDDRCRHLLRRHYFAEETARELAVSFGTSVGYAQRLIHKCLLRARSRYEKLAGEVRCGM